MSKTKCSLTHLVPILLIVLLSIVVIIQSNQTASAQASPGSVAAKVVGATMVKGKAHLVLAAKNGEIITRAEAELSKELSQRVPGQLLKPNVAAWEQNRKRLEAIGSPQVGNASRTGIDNVKKILAGGAVTGGAVVAANVNLDQLKNKASLDGNITYMDPHISVKVWGVPPGGKGYAALEGVVVTLAAQQTGSIHTGCKGPTGPSSGSGSPRSTYMTNQSGQVLFMDCTTLGLMADGHLENLGYSIELANIPSNYTKDANYAKREVVTLVTEGPGNAASPRGSGYPMNYEITIILPNKNELTVKPAVAFPKNYVEVLSANNKAQSVFDINKAASQQATKEAEANDRCRKNEMKNNSVKVLGSSGSSEGGTYKQQGFKPGAPGYQIRVDNVLDPSTYLRYKNRYNDAECTKLHYAREYEIHVKGIDIYDATRRKNAMNNAGVTLRFSGPGKCNGGTKNSSQPYAITNAQGVVRFTGCSRNNIDVIFTNVGRAVNPNNKSHRAMKIIESYRGNNNNKIVLEVELYRTYPDAWRTNFNRAANYYWRNFYSNEKSTITALLKKGNHRILNFLDTRAAPCRPSNVDIRFTWGETGVAYTFIGAGRRSESRGMYCTVYVNSNPAAQGGRSYNSDSIMACMSFTHEYGHTLGFHDYRYSGNLNDPLLLMQASAASGGLPAVDTAKKVSGCHGIFTYGDPSAGQISTGDREGRGSPR